MIRSQLQSNARRRSPRLPMLCMDWGEQSIQVALVQRRQSRLVVREKWQLEYPGSLIDADPEKVGHWLKLQWKEHRIPKRELYVAVPRRNVLLHGFQQQVIRGVHLAETVLLQAESRYPMQMDELVVDFLQQPSLRGDDQRTILTGSISSRIVESIQTATESASINLRGIGVGELGLAGLSFAHQPSEFQLSILANPTSVEVVASRFGIPFVSQSLNVRSDGNEFSQSMFKLIDHAEARIGELGFPQPSSVCVYGPRADALRSVLADRFADVSMFASDGSARLLGLAATFCQPHTNIDFASPQTPPDRKAIRRNRLLRIAACLGIAVVGLSAWLYNVHRELDRELAALQAEHANLQVKLEGSDDVFASAQAISDWNSSRVMWSDEVHSLLQHVGSNQRCYLRRLQLDSLSESGQPSAKIIGLVRESNDALSIADRLVNSPQQYVVQPGPIRPSRQDPHYRSTFDIRIDWRHGLEASDAGE